MLGDSEFLASPEVRSDFGAMDDILARKTGDVGARTSDVFSLNDGSLHPLLGQCPGDVFASFAAAQHEEIVFFRLRGWCIHEPGLFRNDSRRPHARDEGLNNFVIRVSIPLPATWTTHFVRKQEGEGCA